MSDHVRLLQLSQLPAILELNEVKAAIDSLALPSSELMELTHEMYSIGSRSHLNSLNPLVRQELGIQLTFQTEAWPDKRAAYQEKKNKYLSVGKSYSAISFLFDLVSQTFSDLDILLMHELLMDDGQYRSTETSIRVSKTERKTFNAKQIQERVEGLVCEYYEHRYHHPRISPVVLAVMFHYKLVAIHPFNDGNGRISRIFLNLILLQSGFFPVIVPDADRPVYYEALQEADRDNFEPLITFFAKIIKERLSEYLKLTQELSNLRYNVDCLVLTEDGNTTMMENLLRFSGFDMSKTFVESYDGKDNLPAAAFLARKTKDMRPNLKHIIFHRDRDHYKTQQLRQIMNRSVKSNGLEGIATIFITEGYDMESYFILPQHVHALYPAIAVARAEELINQATADCSDTSRKKLRIALAATDKYQKINDPKQVVDDADSAYFADQAQFRYGKGVLWRLEELVTLEIAAPEKVSLVAQTSFINIPELKNALQKLCC